MSYLIDYNIRLPVIFRVKYKGIVKEGYTKLKLYQEKVISSLGKLFNEIKDSFEMYKIEKKSFSKR
jgi:hypothetical protein